MPAAPHPTSNPILVRGPAACILGGELEKSTLAFFGLLWVTAAMGGGGGRAGTGHGGGGLMEQLPHSQRGTYYRLGYSGLRLRHT